MRWPRASLNGLYGRPGRVSPSFAHFTIRVIATDSTRFRGERQSVAMPSCRGGGRPACTPGAREAGGRQPVRACLGLHADTPSFEKPRRTTLDRTPVLSQVKAL